MRDVMMSPDVTSYPMEISIDFRCVANRMQMWLGKKMVISHFGYCHFLSTANTVSDQYFDESVLEMVICFLFSIPMSLFYKF